jgi:hypothetical protein
MLIFDNLAINSTDENLDDFVRGYHFHFIISGAGPSQFEKSDPDPDRNRPNPQHWVIIFISSRSRIIVRGAITLYVAPDYDPEYNFQQWKKIHEKTTLFLIKDDIRTTSLPPTTSPASVMVDMERVTTSSSQCRAMANGRTELNPPICNNRKTLHVDFIFKS